MNKITIGIVAILLATSTMGFAQWKNPTDGWTTIGPPTGTLLIAGGSAVSSIYKAFMDLVGDDPEALIVFIPTAGNDVDENSKGFKILKDAGAKNLVILHTRDREEANSEDFIAPLKKAKAVFIGGGFQKRLAEAYLHTLTHQALFDVLARGGVVAGSSAGASIQGSFLYGGGTEKEGFGLVKQSAIGQHYIRRNRMGGVAKILRNDTSLFGIGIDEATAIVMKGNNFEVIGDSKVVIYDPKQPNWAVPNTQLQLLPGDRFDVNTRKVIYEAKPTPSDVWDRAKEEWVSPGKHWETVGPTAGKVIVYGEEIELEESVNHFLKSSKASKSPIVVLSTGNSDKKAEGKVIAATLTKLGAKNVTTVHTFNRNQANSKAFVEPLKNAAAVLISDSEKWQLADSYLHTLLHKELFEVVKRKGSVGGLGGGGIMLSSDLFSQPYRWNTGFGLVDGVMLFDEPLTSKSKKGLNEKLNEETKFIGIELTKKSIVEFRKNKARIAGDGKVQVYRKTDSNVQTFSPRKKKYSLKVN